MKCEIKKLTPFRLLSMYAYEALGTGHNMYAQIEHDVTGIQRRLRSQRMEGNNVSFFGFLLSAIAKTMDENKELNHIRRGKKIYCFDEVDIYTAIEWELNGVLVPRIYIVRDAAQKTMEDITSEIENVKKNWKESGNSAGEDKWAVKWLHLTKVLPKWLIKCLIRQFSKNPYETKKRFGTTYVASLSGFTNASGSIIPYFEGQNRPLAFAIGNIVKKPGVVNSQIQIREYLSMTISFNHDLVDGAPAARFVNRLKHRIEEYRED
jgi:pyruvate/2-oxoglutarate dehydrogenase complex dihydrolipoamide acyltransferase (E2) component